jgi:hypothetical protein
MLDDDQLRRWWRTYGFILSSIHADKREFAQDPEFEILFEELYTSSKDEGVMALVAETRAKMNAAIKSRAAMGAYADLKRKLGYTTLLEEYGHRPTRIMVESGDLRDSMQSTAESSTSLMQYKPAKNQAVEVTSDKIACGPTLKYAIAHHDARGPTYRGGRALVQDISGEGQYLDNSRGARRLWPEQLPRAWQRGIKDGVANAVHGAMLSLGSAT